MVNEVRNQQETDMTSVNMPLGPGRENAKRVLEKAAEKAREQAKVYQYLIDTLPDDMPGEVDEWVWDKVLSDRQ